MDQYLKEKWCGALESGKYKQGTDWLRRDNDYCCLGVLLEIMGEKRVSMDHDVHVYKTGMSSLNGEFLEKAGLSKETQRKLQIMNDSFKGSVKKDFKEIAQWIRENL